MPRAPLPDRVAGHLLIDSAAIHQRRESGGAARSARGAPVERLGVGEDVARVVLFLADPAAYYITGESVMVTGGELMIWDRALTGTLAPVKLSLV